MAQKQHLHQKYNSKYSISEKYIVTISEDFLMLKLLLLQVLSYFFVIIYNGYWS